MITNGKDTLINGTGNLPNVMDALNGWFQDNTFTLITKTVVDFELVETQVQSSFYGVKQPMSPEVLKLKPEGQRSWDWNTIHSTPELILKTDDIIIMEGHNYRVMERLDYAAYGYLEYHLVKDYQA
jgi:hypothetical protein